MPRGRPRAFNTDEALDEALTLFWRHGYEGTSLAALSEAMGINMPSLYAAFGNKEALFQKVLDRYIQKPASYLPNACRQLTARKVAESLLHGAIEMIMQPKAADGCLLVHGALATGPGGEGVRAELARRRAGGEALIRKRFEQAVSEGDLPKSVDPEALARYLMTMVWGMSVQAAGGADRGELESVAEMTMRSFPSSNGE